MDTKKQPGIQFKGIRVTRINFDVNEEVLDKTEKLMYDLEFSVSDKLSNEANRLDLVVDVKFSPPADPPPYKLAVSLVAVFETIPGEANLDLKDFARNQALAHIFPFLRELVLNVTSRSKLPPLVLPPTNIRALMAAASKGK